MTEQGRQPVIVGVAQLTDTTTPPERARAPVDLMAAAARAAAADSGAGDALLRSIDSLAVIRLFSDSSPRFRSPFGRMRNPPWSVARRIGAAPRELVYPIGGGNTPQVMLNRACERIARGDAEVALVVGGEALRTELAARRAGIPLDWNEDAPTEPDELGGHRLGYSEHEALHGVRAAINVYPMIENAIRGARGRTIAEHRDAMGRLLARFAAVAKANPLATHRQGYGADEITTVSADNPMIGFPYTKRMNASAYVDMAAAVLVCSSTRADALGIARERRVFLHGCAQGDDHWHVTERFELHRSPAIRHVVADTLAMAGRRLDEVDLFDLYACFSSAVEIACEEIGLAEDDARGLTVTGGLPYFGGPGNNYVTHAVAEMVQRLRARPGRFGLVTANGNYVTKHAAGLYSTTPLAGPWRREDPARLQARLNALPKAPFTTTPEGPATVETYTVVHGRHGPELGIVFGRVAEGGARFVAVTPDDAATLADLEARDALGRLGRVRVQAGRNVFTPD